MAVLPSAPINTFSQYAHLSAVELGLFTVLAPGPLDREPLAGHDAMVVGIK